MFERRVVFKFRVTYQTPRDKLKIIPELVREAIEEQENIRFNHANFHTYGASSLDFEIVCYILLRYYNQHMDIQQTINLRIHVRFEQEGIDFVYPTEPVYLHRMEREQIQ